MIEAILGTLGLVAVWFAVDLLAGDLLRRPLEILLGPPAGKFVVVLAWVVVAILGWLSYESVERHWSDGWAWMAFFIASVLSLVALVVHKEEL